MTGTVTRHRECRGADVGCRGTRRATRGPWSSPSATPYRSLGRHDPPVVPSELHAPRRSNQPDGCRVKGIGQTWRLDAPPNSRDTGAAVRGTRDPAQATGE
jgi:hypothetical protein